MKVEIPENYRKDFEDIVKTKKYQNIKMAVNYLNSQLESMFVYRSKKTREDKVSGVSKRWLQLDFAVIERSVLRREPLPLVIELNMVNAVCSKCGFKWRTDFGSWLKSKCPKCGAFEIGMENEKKE